jgi:hypothetical protein
MLLRVFGHTAMRCAEAFMLAWVVWTALDVIRTRDVHEGGGSAWFYLVQNGVWEFWEHLFLVGDSTVRAGTWWLVVACLCIVTFLRYRKSLARLLEG